MAPHVPAHRQAPAACTATQAAQNASRDTGSHPATHQRRPPDPQDPSAAHLTRGSRGPHAGPQQHRPGAVGRPFPHLDTEPAANEPHHRDPRLLLPPQITI
eukprot:6318887-Prorocentrum_lima.AAC.1